MKFFHLNGGKPNWPLAILTLAAVVVAYSVIGQLPLIFALVSSGLMTSGFEPTVGDMAETLGYNTFLTYLIIPFIFGLAVIMLSVKFIFKRPVFGLFTTRTYLDLNRVLLSFMIWFGIMGFFLIISYYSGSPLEWNFKSDTFFSLLLISLFLIPLQTTCEEVLFRGFLMQLLGPTFKKAWISILLTGILFGVLHGANPEVQKIGNILLIYYVMTGVFLGVMAQMDEGLELSIGYHAANNIFAALIVTNDWQAFQTDALFMDRSGPQFGWDSLLTLIILQPALLLLFSKIYGWKGWKEKLFSEPDIPEEEYIHSKDDHEEN